MEKVNKPMLVEDGHLPEHTERGRRRCEECAGAPPQWHQVLNIRVLNNGLVNSEANNGRLGKGGNEPQGEQRTDTCTHVLIGDDWRNG